MATWVTPLLREPGRRFRLVNAATGAVVASSVAGAFDSATRRRGLLGRDSMPVGEALIIAPTNAIHTFFMRFDIDVAFVDRGGRVLKVASRLRPWRLSAAMRAFGVVEVPAGTFEAASTARGDVLKLEPD